MSKMVDEYVRQGCVGEQPGEADRTGEFGRRDIALALLTKLDGLYRELAVLREDRVQLAAALATVEEEREELRGVIGELRGIATCALDQRDQAWAELLELTSGREAA